MSMFKLNIIITVIFAISLFSSVISAQGITANHNTISGFEDIPLSIIETIDTGYDVYYVHTSHGSQIMTGIDMVCDEDNNYISPPFHEVSDDLGHTGDTSWVPATRAYLDSHLECNMAMFSWCGGCSDNTEAGINIYLNKMVELELDYPAITFIYMTGHLDGSGVNGNLYTCNNQIRDFCSVNNKILFDFADIESYDPDSNYYPDETDACNWCYDWCAIYTCPTCGSCAHSHCFNCYLKGKAWWWMMARISGWNSTEDACGDANSDHTVNVSDAVWIINYVFVGGDPPDPMAAGDVNCDGSVNVSDAVMIVNYVFVGGNAPCDIDGDAVPDC